MKKAIKVFANKEEAGRCFCDQEEKKCTFRYTKDNPISLVMPYRKEPLKQGFCLKSVNMPWQR